jgi:SAM-dependent methyltransferase
MPTVFDLRLLDRRRRRALATAAPGADFLLRAVADDLVDRLGAVKRGFGLAVDLGTPGRHLLEALRRSSQVGRLVRIDRLAEADADIVADVEALPLAPESLDLVVSALAFQSVNDVPGAFAQIRRALRPDGLFLAVLAGGDTLHELRTALAAAEAEIRGGAAPRVGPFAELSDVGGLLQRAGFALPVIDRERLTVRYDSALHLMRDLRAMGATSVLAERDPRPLTRAIVVRATEIYAERFADPDGRVRATFTTLWVSGWAPHESQQKPLRPGSARTRLADALRTVEVGAGEKAGGPASGSE